jgi:hypothetical protein
MVNITLFLRNDASESGSVIFFPPNKDVLRLTVELKLAQL